MTLAEPWPPVYDEQDLLQTIRRAAEANPKQFYTSLEGPSYCQGDIIRLNSGAPVIDEDGSAVAIGDFHHWLVLGNTCDLDRSIADVQWACIVPIHERHAMPAEQMSALRSYQVSRWFYIPGWADDSDVTYAADFTNAVSLHKAVLQTESLVVARMSRAAWVLLHACLIRYLARGDRRWL